MFLKSELSGWKIERPQKKSFNYFNKTTSSISFDILNMLPNIERGIYFSVTDDSLALSNSSVGLKSFYSTLQDWVMFRKMPPISIATFSILTLLKYSNLIAWENNRWCADISVFWVITRPPNPGLAVSFDLYNSEKFFFSHSKEITFTDQNWLIKSWQVMLK